MCFARHRSHLESSIHPDQGLPTIARHPKSIYINVASAFFMHSSKTCHQRHPTTSSAKSPIKFSRLQVSHHFAAFLDVIHPEVSGWLANGMAPLIASWPLSISQLEKSYWKCRLMLAHLLVTRHATHNTWSIPPSNPQSKFAFDSLQARSGYCSQFLHPPSDFSWDQTNSGTNSGI